MSGPPSLISSAASSECSASDHGDVPPYLSSSSSASASVSGGEERRRRVFSAAESVQAADEALFAGARADREAAAARSSSALAAASEALTQPLGRCGSSRCTPKVVRAGEDHTLVQCSLGCNVLFHTPMCLRPSKIRSGGECVTPDCAGTVVCCVTVTGGRRDVLFKVLAPPKPPASPKIAGGLARVIAPPKLASVVASVVARPKKAPEPLQSPLPPASRLPVVLVSSTTPIAPPPRVRLFETPPPPPPPPPPVPFAGAPTQPRASSSASVWQAASAARTVPSRPAYVAPSRPAWPSADAASPLGQQSLRICDMQVIVCDNLTLPLFFKTPTFTLSPTTLLAPRFDKTHNSAIVILNEDTGLLHGVFTTQTSSHAFASSSAVSFRRVEPTVALPLTAYSDFISKEQISCLIDQVLPVRILSLAGKGLLNAFSDAMTTAASAHVRLHHACHVHARLRPRSPLARSPDTPASATPTLASTSLATPTLASTSLATPTTVARPLAVSEAAPSPAEYLFETDGESLCDLLPHLFPKPAAVVDVAVEAPPAAVPAAPKAQAVEELGHRLRCLECGLQTAAFVYTCGAHGACMSCDKQSFAHKHACSHASCAKLRIYL